MDGASQVATRRAGVVIVGGGVMGVSIALHLAARLDPLAEPVLLLERRELAAGSSGRSGAILRQFYSSRELAGMARDALKVYADFARNTGRSVGFQRTGVLTLAGPERREDVELVRSNAALMRDIGIDVELLDAAAVTRLVPGIEAAPGTLAAWEPGAGQVDPVLAIQSFAAIAKSRGATLRVGCEVEAILIEDGRVRGVRHGDEVVECERVVVAGGPWTRRLLAATGIELPLRTVRAEQHFVAMPESGVAGLRREPPHVPEAELGDRFGTLEAELPPAAHPVLLDLERVFYARCESRSGRTRVGAMSVAQDEDVDPDAFDETVSGAFAGWARERLERRMPVYRERADAGELVGLYTMTPDGQAVIGELAGARGLFVASGFSGHGFKLAPSIGEGVAQLVCGQPVSAFDPAFFAPERFTDVGAGSGALRGFGL
jgi:glycine/D-amino acid oxidase-like deaminating enzyme